ncbi:MAG TPA: hypothetical protein VER39_01555 [Nocardioidaceae bacterium]|nr:hypothetical protein [Nocardioidaceae bacterium]
MFRIVIAANALPVRPRLARLVASEPGLKVVGHAGGSSETLGMVRRTSADVVLVDLSAAPRGTLDLIAVVRRALPGVLIVAVLGTASRQTIRDAFEAGASAFLRRTERLRGHGLGAWTFVLPDDADEPPSRSSVETNEDRLRLQDSVVGDRSAARLPFLSPSLRADEASADRRRPGCRGTDRERRTRWPAIRRGRRHDSP